MKKDTIFRAVNFVGMAASCASMAYPYAHPMRINYKLVSTLCGMASMAILASSLFPNIEKIAADPDKGIGLGVSILNSFLVNNANVTTWKNINHAMHTPGDISLDSNYLVRDGAVAAAQLLAFAGGMDCQVPKIFSRKSDKLTP